MLVTTPWMRRWLDTLYKFIRQNMTLKMSKWFKRKSSRDLWSFPFMRNYVSLYHFSISYKISHVSLSLSLSPTNKPVWFVSADGMVISNKRVSQSMAAVYMYIVRDSLEGAGCEQGETWKESVSSVSGSGPKSSRAH